MAHLLNRLLTSMGPEFGPQQPCKKPGEVACIVIPASEVGE